MKENRKSEPERYVESSFGDEVGLSKLGYRWAPAGFRSSPQNLRTWVLVYVHQGCLQVTYGRREHPIEAGRVALLDPFSNFSLACVGLQACEFLYARFTFQFHPKRPVRANLDLPRFDIEEVPGMADQLRKTAEYFSQSDEPDLHALRQPMHELILRVVHAITTTQPDAVRNTQGNGLIASIERFLEHNTENPLNLQTVGEAFYLSSSHLSRLFRKATGMTIKQRHHQQRMKRAAELLTQTDRTVTQIAGDLGFRTVHHFSRRFKEHYGVSPGAYRSAKRQSA